MDKVWKEANDLVSLKNTTQTATGIRLNISKLFISYTDASGKTQRIDLQDSTTQTPELDALRASILTIQKERLWSASKERPCTRSLCGEKPLILSKNKEATWRNITAEEFLKLLDKTNPLYTPNTQTKIEAAEKNIQDKQRETNDKVIRIEIGINYQKKADATKTKKGAQESPRLQALRKQLEELKLLQLRLGEKNKNGDGLDRFAIYAAISLETSPTKIAEKISEILPDEHFESVSELSLYAEETGDLIITNQFDYFKNIEKSNNDPQRPCREAKRESLEQYFVQQTLNSNNTSNPLEEQMFSCLTQQIPS